MSILQYTKLKLVVYVWNVYKSKIPVGSSIKKTHFFYYFLQNASIFLFSIAEYNILTRQMHTNNLK